MLQDVTAKFTLKDEHRDYLHRCALSDGIIDGRPYYSLDVESREYLSKRWLFSNEALRGGGIVIPRYTPDGEETFPQIRYEEPRLVGNATKPQKYNAPVKSGGVVDVHPEFTAQVQDASEPLVFVESVKGADALLSVGILACGFHGCWGWSHGKGISLEFSKIALRGREVDLLFDRDSIAREDLRLAVRAFGSALTVAGGAVHVLMIPSTFGEKAGADDVVAVLKAATTLVGKAQHG
jgi:hypothetical protein